MSVSTSQPVLVVVETVTDFDLLTREGWSPGDLEANRRGWLSPRQVELVRRRLRLYPGAVLTRTVPILLIALGGAIVGLVMQSQPGYLLIPLLIALFFSPMWLFVGVRVRAVRADLAASRIGRVEGRLDGMFVNSQSGQSRVRIATTTMLCYGSPWDRGWREGLDYVLHEHRSGAALRAYYLPRSRLFVAAERLDRPAS